MSNIKTECLIIDEDTPCGREYLGYPLLTSRYMSVANFSYQLQSLMHQPLAIAIQLGGPTTKEGLHATASMRYQESLQCSLQVNDALEQACQHSAGGNRKSPILCNTQCHIAITTLKEYMTKYSKKTVDEQLSIQKNFVEFCKTAAILQPLQDNVNAF
jgi:hypothetical protein